MLPEGVARLFMPGPFVDGPWSEHYEPAESPVANPLHPEHSSNPAVRAFTTDDVLGKPDEFPIVCTTYRLTEHFHYWTKNNPYNVQLSRSSSSRSPRNWRGKRDRESRRGARHLGARIDRGPRDGHAPHQADAGRRAHGVSDRIPDPLGLPRTRPAARVAGQSRDAHDRRSEFVRAGIQGFLVKLEKV